MAKENRYSDKDLNQFKKKIVQLIVVEKDNLELLMKATDNSDSNDTDDTLWNQKMAEENAGLPTKEDAERDIQKQKDKIKSLELALTRIENKTYGVCHRSGELISKERLEAMPTATTNIFK